MEISRTGELIGTERKKERQRQSEVVNELGNRWPWDLQETR